MTTATATTTTAPDIERARLDEAGRFIEAILARDRLVRLLGEDYRVGEAERLWDRFVERYREVTSGPYAKRGRDAFRVAISAL